MTEVATSELEVGEMATERNPGDRTSKLVPCHTAIEKVASGVYAYGWGGGLGPDGIATDICDTEAEAKEQLCRLLAAAGRRPAVPSDYPLPITGGF
jgi:hypothetical protein